jgi:L-alanine-DL-glutamate epimerase-like enolase superfamily enzyme
MTLRITGVETAAYRIPLPVPLSDSTHGIIPAFELLVVRLRCNEGVEGVGYAYTIKGVRAIKALVEDLLVNVLLGEDPFHTEAIWEKMWWATHFVGRGGVATLAMAACDVALWDAKGQATGRSLAQLLGGSKKSVVTYAGGVDLQFPLRALVDQAVANVEGGFTAIKMKVGHPDSQEDVERVRAVRKAVGDEITLMVDANMAWRVDEAICAARRMEPYGVYWLEEPTIPDDVSGHCRIARSTSIPIAAGENLYTKHEFLRYMECGSVAFPEPDLVRVGGITEWMKIAALAASHNLPVTSHGVDEIHVHLLAAVPNASYLEHHAFRIDEYLREPFVLSEGCVEVPDRPGHGVIFDWEKLASCRVR